MLTAIPTNTDEYIKNFPKEVQKILQQIRGAIKKAAPDAKERISYAIPTFTLHGNLVHFAAYKNHIGFYPVPQKNVTLNKQIAKYRTGKGTLQFPLDEPLPLDLISKIVKVRIKENSDRIKAKKIAAKTA